MDERRRNVSNGIEILIAEDSPTQAEQLKHYLSARGYSVRMAGDGKQALAAALENKPAMLITDVVMPEMDGPTLLTNLRRRGSDVKIIFVSGYAEDAFGKHPPDDGKYTFLPKPFTLKQLVGAVKEAIGT